MSRVCESCPVGRTDGTCVTVPSSLSTCVKRINKIRMPSITIREFQSEVVRHALPEIITPKDSESGTIQELKFSLESGDWRKNDFIVDVMPERNKIGDGLVGFTVIFTDKSEIFINFGD
jgi:hypothetical protein